MKSNALIILIYGFKIHYELLIQDNFYVFLRFFFGSLPLSRHSSYVLIRSIYMKIVFGLKLWSSNLEYCKVQYLGARINLNLGDCNINNQRLFYPIQAYYLKIQWQVWCPLFEGLVINYANFLTVQILWILISPLSTYEQKWCWKLYGQALRTLLPCPWMPILHPSFGASSPLPWRSYLCWDNGY